MAEHRMYLTLAGGVVTVVGLLHAAARRKWQYRSDLVLWLDSVAKRPGSALAQANVAYARVALAVSRPA